MSLKSLPLALLGAMALLAATVGAHAFPDAQIDSQLRPHFGELLHPPIRRYHPYRPVYRLNRWEFGYGGRYEPLGPDYDHYRGPWTDRHWRGDHGYPEQGPIQTITVDCGDTSAGPTPLSDALFALADGGTLYIRSGGRACSETLVITRPVTIVGEAASAFDSASPGPPAIAPPPGLPCIQVMPGAGRVELRDLILRADHAGPAACVQSWDSELALVHADVRYAGDASAVYVSGGRLVGRHSQVGSGGYDPAVTTEGASLDLDSFDITTAVNGLDITPGTGPIALDYVGVSNAPGVDPSLTPETGITIRYAPHGGEPLFLRGSHVSGFRTGLWLDQGARIQVTGLSVSHAVIGVVSRAVDLKLTDSTLTVASTGVYVVMGHARIVHNTIHDFDGPPILVERGADVFVDDNGIWPMHRCHEYRDYKVCHEHEEKHEHPHEHDHEHGPDEHH